MKTYISEFTTDTTNTRAEGVGWLVRLGYHSGGMLRVGSYDMNITLNTNVVGCVVNVEGMESGFDIQNSKWIDNRITVTLSDGFVGGETALSLTDKSLSGVMAGKNFTGRNIAVFRITKSMTTTLSHDKEFYGIISDVSYDDESRQYTISATSWGIEARAPIGTLVTKADYPEAPSESFGMVIPVVYGSFQHLLVSSTYESDLLANNFHYAPSVCIDAANGRFAFASHAVKTLNNTDIAIYSPSIRNYLTGVYAYTGSTSRPTTTLTGPAYVDITPPASFQWWSADAIYLLPTLTGSKNSGTITSRSNLYDSAYDSVSVFSTGGGGNDYITQRFQSLGSDIELYKTASSTDIKISVYVPANNGMTWKVVMWNPITGAGDESSGHTGTGWITDTFGTFGDRSDTAGGAITSTDQWNLEELSRYDFGIKGETASKSISIGFICVMILRPIIAAGSFQPLVMLEPRQESQAPSNDPFWLLPNDYGLWRYPTPLERLRNRTAIQRTIATSAVFAEIEGRKFGSWIDDVGRSNSYSSGDLITKSCYQIESLLRDELGYGNAEIIETDFDDVSTASYDTKFSINALTNASDVIQDLSFFTNSITFPNSDGSWSHARIPTDPEGDAESVMTVDWKDIRPLSINKTSLSDLCNKVSIEYSYDYGANIYRKEYATSDATSQGSSVDGYESEYEKKFQCKFFRYASDGSTDYAHTFADAYLANWKDQHNIFEFEMLNFAGFGLEEGDQIIFDNFERNIGGIGAGSAGDYWSSFTSPRTVYWMIVNRRPYLDKVIFTAFQLHNLT